MGDALCCCLPAKLKAKFNIATPYNHKHTNGHYKVTVSTKSSQIFLDLNLGTIYLCDPTTQNISYYFQIFYASPRRYRLFMSCHFSNVLLQDVKEVEPSGIALTMMSPEGINTSQSPEDTTERLLTNGHPTALWHRNLYNLKSALKQLTNKLTIYVNYSHLVLLIYM